ncbi:uncharacterized protein LOC120351026 [Nilaparvata lugens]|uniref:uncharacterized protein LOC120351026 n=1 Tax=Nilaparvata lugens TaxID=108931 RepID=UPI00193D5515|nr:uncharacterized protein LOC120351026 [Nilaparvata lugens]
MIPFPTHKAMAVVVREPKKRKGEEVDVENKKVKKRSVWMRESSREEMYEKYDEIESSIPYKFMEILGIDKEAFNSILKKISRKIHKADTLMRQAIPARLKLQSFCEYVVTGCTFSSLERLFHVSATSISKYIPEVADAILAVFPEFIQVIESIDNCAGVIQGKTIFNKQWKRYSKDTALYYWLATDTRNSLVCVDIGTCHTDGLSFPLSNLAESLRDKSLNLPEKCFFIGPSGVQSEKHIVTPFDNSQRDDGLLSDDEAAHNRHLEKVSMTADDTLKLLSGRFKLFDSPAILAPETVVKLLKSCCLLHNWMQRVVKSGVETSEEVAADLAPGRVDAPGIIKSGVETSEEVAADLAPGRVDAPGIIKSGVETSEEVAADLAPGRVDAPGIIKSGVETSEEVAADLAPGRVDAPGIIKSEVETSEEVAADLAPGRVDAPGIIKSEVETSEEVAADLAPGRVDAPGIIKSGVETSEEVAADLAPGRVDAPGIIKSGVETSEEVAADLAPGRVDAPGIIKSGVETSEEVAADLAPGRVDAPGIIKTPGSEVIDAPGSCVDARSWYDKDW